jgi:tetratricopeptide (TPR) repeat protein
MSTAAQFKIFLCISFVCFLLFSAPALRAQDTGDIAGEVRLSSTGAFPPQKVMVTLQIHGAALDSMYCDNEGRFAFYDLLPNLYSVTIDSEDYQPVRVTVVLNPKISRTSYVRISIMPKEKAAAEKPPDAASGSNPFAINAADSGKSFPPEVKKEYDAGVKADGQGKADEAIRHYQKAIDLAPDFYPARNNLGVHYMGKGDLKGAEAEFTQVIKVHQSDAAAYFNLGNVYYLTKRYDDAARTIQDGLRRDPTSALGNFLMGAVSIRLGQNDAAERYLRRAIELDPSMSRAHLELVNLYLQQQKKKEAVDELKSFEKLFPLDPLLPQVKATLAKLNTSPAN